ncbi:YhjD/YihY/BrkB family envelope integrity protein [Methylomicrobium sp. Wu6]|uniref:YhjD/YihY/BrkB family envelope integrity protein n=1 Tax=Methylomicrobium sp. Wu6 TaxID=3107928 RepID=UPI002DD6AB96|nr:YhjD/YihY/BrkB family envelope integrity protein [Methylomicrobium sp. Wu6]MEC4750339.1 YhjD/YihY/BrkB family envelope integrity protein [Methylomicrobium sp. Wu6]
MSNFDTIKHYLTIEIWQESGEPGSGFAKRTAALLRGVLILVQEATAGDLRYRAMGLVYTTLLSLAPLLAVSFSVLKAFGVHNQLKPLLLSVLEPLGDKGVEMAAQIIGYVENINIGVLGAAGLVFLLYTVISLLNIIEECFNRIWRAEMSRNWIRRSSDYLSMLLVGPVLVVSALGVMASMADTGLVRKLIAQEPFGSAYYLAGLILPYVLIIAALTFLYIFMPNTRVNFRSALAGGIAAGLTWKIVGWVFGIFVEKSASYNAIYSSFAIILLSVIWLYVSWLIVLLGGVISFLHQHPRYLLHKNKKPDLTHRQQETLGFLIMYLIGRAYYEGKAPWTLHALAEEVDLPWEAVQHTLQGLEKAGFVIAIQSEPNAYVPAREIDTITLKAIYGCLRAFDGQAQMTMMTPKIAESVLALAIHIEDAALAVLGDRTLSDLIHLSPRKTLGDPS